MKVLMISTDRKLFEEGSAVEKRTKKYGERMEELHVIVFSLRKGRLRKKRIAQNTIVYPTHSFTRFQYIRDAIRVAKCIDFERVTTQDPFLAGWAGVKIAQGRKVPLQVQIHTDFLSEGFVKDSYRNRFYKRVAAYTLPKADCVRVVSEKIKEGISIEYKLKSTPEVLPIFVDIEKVKNTKEAEKEFPFQIIMASRLEPEKSIERALRAFSEIAKGKENIGKMILGDGSEREKLENLARDCGLEGKVLFKGWIDNSISHIKSSDLFLQTSLFEGYGMSVVEALACGVPVLSTDVGIAREYGADIFKTDKELKEKIEKYINGSYKGELKNYPYNSEEEYTQRYVELLKTCGS